MEVQKAFDFLETIIDKHPLTTTAVVAVLGGFLWEAIKITFIAAREFGDDWTGRWYLTIYDSLGKPEKQDLWKLKKRGRTIIGRITRLEPLDQSHMRYKCVGRLVGNDFIGAFWSERQNIASYGCWFMSLSTTDTELSGYYMHPPLPGQKLGPIRMTLVRRKAARAVRLVNS